MLPLEVVVAGPLGGCYVAVAEGRFDAAGGLCDIAARAVVVVAVLVGFLMSLPFGRSV